MTGPPAAYNGRYELRNQVARGGTAQVYLARDLLLDRPVALKVLDPQLSTDHAFVERFRREAQAAANLSHPNIVPVFDWGEADRTYFIVMEYVDGEPLSSIIRTQAPLDPEQAASIAADIARALSYAHRHGVVHRDVKPGNVLITSDGQVKVTDFGIARAIGADEQVTQTGLVMGTATYFSPEQAQGLGVDGRSDLYALGVVLFEMVTGRPPFTGETPVSIAYQHVREVPPTPRSLNPSVPPALEAIILQAMAKVPAERYATADDLRGDLERFLHHQPVVAKVPGEYAGTVAPLTQETRLLSATQIAPAVRREERARTTTPYWVMAGLVLLAGLVVAVVLGGRALGYFGGKAFVTVPDVRTMSPSVAESTLKSKGFVADVTKHVTGNSSDENTVTNQSPAALSSARKGSAVDLTVAGKVPTTSVPSVLNLTYTQAKALLQQAGFKVKERPVAPTNPQQANNQVIDQSATKTAPTGSTITLSVVKTTSVTVPSLANDNEAAAGAALQQAMLKLGTITNQYSPTVASGEIIGSTPPSGTSVPQGTTVNLVVSQGAGVSVPNIVGDSESEAISALQAAGLQSVKGAAYPTTDPADVGNVAFQQPAASNAVAPGTTVKYRIGVGVGAATTTTTTAGNSGTTTTVPGNTGSSSTTTLPPNGVP